MKNIDLSKWRHGDDARAARILLEDHGVNVSREALRIWRKGGGSKLSPLYESAYNKVFNNRSLKAQTT